MADPKEKDDDIAIMEAGDGSATVELPEGMLADDGYVEGKDKDETKQAKNEGGEVNDEDADDPNDNEELRAAKRNRRRAKKDLIRKTNQEKDVRLQQLQRENEEFKKRLSQLERNTKAEQVTRLEKGIEDAEVRMEYAKMKLAEAASSGDGNALVEAQTLWDNAREEVRRLNGIRQQAEQEMKRQQQPQMQISPDVQRQAAKWMKRNSWYNPQASDTDSRVAKSIDEQMSSEGWDPTKKDYWEELDNRLQKVLPHRYNESNDDESREVRRPRNVVGSSGREASAAYGGTNRTQFVLSPDRVKAMKDAGAWDNPERKARMIKNFIEFDRRNGGRN
jgi:hypothetical protein